MIIFEKEYEHDSAKMVIAGMLRLNIDELKRILADVEVCCETATGEQE